MTGRVQDAAVRYIRAGLAPVPVYNGKDPGRNGWQNTRMTAEQVGEHFPGEANVGILTGEPSGGAVDVDFDCEEAVALAGRFLTPTLTSGRESRRHSHWWYVAPACPTLEFRDGAEKIVELRADGRQTLVAPSVHPEGDRYIWHSESGLGMAGVETDELTVAVRKLATATVIARHLPGHRKTGGGGRHDFALALAGYMLRPGRLDRESVKSMLTAAWDAGGWSSEADRREAVKDIDAAVTDTLSNLERGEPTTGGRTLEEMEAGLPRAIGRYWGWGDDREDAGGEGKEEKPTQAELLLRYAASAELFHTPAGDAYATIPVAGHKETHPMKHKAFRRWLMRLFYEEQGKPPGMQALQDTLGVLEAKAHFDGPEREVFVRVAGYEGAIYVDLANEAWEAVEITAGGWRVASDPPVKFRRPRGMKALPRPEEGGKATELGGFVNADGEGQLTLILAWLVAALRDRGPYPVLVLRGEQGSAKSTTARLLRELVDPVVAAIRSLPASERDLAISASNNHVPAFDNVSRLPEWISDALARLATGGGLSTRELYSDDEEVLFDATRPVILNGITDVATRPDLLDRAVIVEMAAIPEEGRRREAELMAAFEEKRPAILGALFSAVSRALAEVASVRLDNTPRMADFAGWATAAEEALGLSPGEFMDAYTANRAAATETALEADPVAEAVMSLMSDREEWAGTATELWEALGEQVSEEVRKSKVWPGAPNALTGRLRRLAPELRAVGIEYAEGSRSDPTGTKNKYLAKNKAKKDRQSRQSRQNEENSAEEWEGVTDDVSDDTGGTDDKTVRDEKDRQKDRQNENPANKGNGATSDDTDGSDDDFPRRSKRRL